MSEPGKRRYWLDAIGVGMLLVALWPELAEKRLWLYLAVKASREGARRCGQLAIVAERAYHREVA